MTINNMNNLSFKKIATVAGLFLGAFAISAFAANWTPPTNVAPGGNTGAPINITSTPQYKLGPLAIGKDSNPNESFSLDVVGAGNFSTLLTLGLKVSGRTDTEFLKVGGAGAATPGYVLTNTADAEGKASGVAEWKPATGGGGGSGLTDLDSSYCYAQTQVSENLNLFGYYLKGYIKLNRESRFGQNIFSPVYCKQSGSTDPRMTSDVISTITKGPFRAVAIGKSVTEILDFCRDKNNYSAFNSSSNINNPVNCEWTDLSPR
jgi:hypothetical protein